MQLFGIERINNEEHASSIFISELENDYSHRVNGVLNELTIQTHTYRVPHVLLHNSSAERPLLECLIEDRLRNLYDYREFITLLGQNV